MMKLNHQALLFQLGFKRKTIKSYLSIYVQEFKLYTYIVYRYRDTLYYQITVAYISYNKQYILFSRLLIVDLLVDIFRVT